MSEFTLPSISKRIVQLYHYIEGKEIGEIA
jgi:hypothetical protein